MSSPEINPAESAATPLPMERELLEMPNGAPETDGLDEDIYWDDGSA